MDGGAGKPSIAKKACLPCSMSKRRCADARPCPRCIKLGIPEECVERPEGAARRSRGVGYPPMHHWGQVLNPLGHHAPRGTHPGALLPGSGIVGPQADGTISLGGMYGAGSNYSPLASYNGLTQHSLLQRHVSQQVSVAAHTNLEARNRLMTTLPASSPLGLPMGRLFGFDTNNSAAVMPDGTQSSAKQVIFPRHGTTGRPLPSPATSGGYQQQAMQGDSAPADSPSAPSTQKKTSQERDDKNSRALAGLLALTDAGHSGGGNARKQNGRWTQPVRVDAGRTGTAIRPIVLDFDSKDASPVLGPGMPSETRCSQQLAVHSARNAGDLLSAGTLQASFPSAGALRDPASLRIALAGIKRAREASLSGRGAASSQPWNGPASASGYLGKQIGGQTAPSAGWRGLGLDIVHSTTPEPMVKRPRTLPMGVESQTVPAQATQNDRVPLDSARVTDLIRQLPTCAEVELQIATAVSMGKRRGGVEAALRKAAAWLASELKEIAHSAGGLLTRGAPIFGGMPVELQAHSARLFCTALRTAVQCIDAGSRGNGSLERVSMSPYGIPVDSKMQATIQAILDYCPVPILSGHTPSCVPRSSIRVAMQGVLQQAERDKKLDTAMERMLRAHGMLADTSVPEIQQQLGRTSAVTGANMKPALAHADRQMASMPVSETLASSPAHRAEPPGNTVSNGQNDKDDQNQTVDSVLAMHSWAASPSLCGLLGYNVAQHGQTEGYGHRDPIFAMENAGGFQLAGMLNAMLSRRSVLFPGAQILRLVARTMPGHTGSSTSDAPSVDGMLTADEVVQAVSAGRVLVASQLALHARSQGAPATRMGPPPPLTASSSSSSSASSSSASSSSGAAASKDAENRNATPQPGNHPPIPLGSGRWLLVVPVLADMIVQCTYRDGTTVGQSPQEAKQKLSEAEASTSSRGSAPLSVAKESASAVAAAKQAACMKPSKSVSWKDLDDMSDEAGVADLGGTRESSEFGEGSEQLMATGHVRFAASCVLQAGALERDLVAQHVGTESVGSGQGLSGSSGLIGAGGTGVSSAAVGIEPAGRDGSVVSPAARGELPNESAVCVAFRDIDAQLRFASSSGRAGSMDGRAGAEGSWVDALSKRQSACGADAQAGCPGRGGGSGTSWAAVEPVTAFGGLVRVRGRFDPIVCSLGAPMRKQIAAAIDASDSTGTASVLAGLRAQLGGAMGALTGLCPMAGEQEQDQAGAGAGEAGSGQSRVWHEEPVPVHPICRVSTSIALTSARLPVASKLAAHVVRDLASEQRRQEVSLQEGNRGKDLGVRERQEPVGDAAGPLAGSHALAPKAVASSSSSSSASTSRGSASGPSSKGVLL